MHRLCMGFEREARLSKDKTHTPAKLKLCNRFLPGTVRRNEGEKKKVDSGKIFEVTSRFRASFTAVF